MRMALCEVARDADWVGGWVGGVCLCLTTMGGGPRAAEELCLHRILASYVRDAGLGTGAPA
jgi:hypothetical protein